jgi:hypothetical protein
MRLPLAATMALTFAACAQPPPRATSEAELAAARATFAAAPRRAPVVWTLARPTPEEVRAAHAAVRAVLRDPDSARFGAIIALNGSNGQRSICGVVNSRNGFGGYAGDTAFHWSPGSPPMLASERTFAMLFPAICQARTVT